MRQTALSASAAQKIIFWLSYHCSAAVYAEYLTVDISGAFGSEEYHYGSAIAFSIAHHTVDGVAALETFKVHLLNSGINSSEPLIVHFCSDGFCHTMKSQSGLSIQP